MQGIRWVLAGAGDLLGADLTASCGGGGGSSRGISHPPVHKSCPTPPRVAGDMHGVAAEMVQRRTLGARARGSFRPVSARP